jgi:hypothetical protein
MEGAIQGLQAAASAIEQIIKQVDQEVDSGKLELEQASFLKRYMIRCHQVTVSLAAKTENNRIAQGGRLAALGQAVQVAKKFHSEEKQKAETLRVSLREKSTLETVEGEIEDRPPLSMKARRQLEDAAEDAAPKGEQKGPKKRPKK